MCAERVVTTLWRRVCQQALQCQLVGAAASRLAVLRQTGGFTMQQEDGRGL